jgi:peptidylprolyl isomerase
MAAGLLAAIALAACGSSKAPGIAHAPSGGAIRAAAATQTTASDQADAPVTTPKPPSPLATEPKIVTPKGPPPKTLVVKDLIKGNGDNVMPGDFVTVNYVGALYSNGKVFDASWSRHQTFTTELSNGSVVSGWVKGIVGERIGGRRELIIPPNLAYGASGNPPKIPPNATLIFDIDVLHTHAASGDD